MMMIKTQLDKILKDRPRSKADGANLSLQSVQPSLAAAETPQTKGRDIENLQHLIGAVYESLVNLTDLDRYLCLGNVIKLLILYDGIAQSFEDFHGRETLGHDVLHGLLSERGPRLDSTAHCRAGGKHGDPL